MRRMRHLKPREIQGCQLALDASLPGTLFDATSGGSLVAADGAVARWEDVSGNARHVTQATAGGRPARKAANFGGLDSLDFNGTSHAMQSSLSATLNNQSGFAMYTVHASDDGTALRQIARYCQDTGGLTTRVGIGERLTTNGRCFFSARRLDGDAAVNTESSATAGTGANVAVVSVSFASASFQGFEKGAQTASATVGTSGNTSATDKVLQVGSANAGFYYDGRIAEIGAYHGTLNSSQRQRLTHSRMRKWRIAG